MLYKGTSRKKAEAKYATATKKINSRYGVEDGLYEAIVPETGDELTVAVFISDTDPEDDDDGMLEEAYYETAYGPYEDEGIALS